MKSNRLSQMMRNLLLMLIVLLSLSGIKTVAAQDVSFDITEADITGEISSDGNVSFKESLFIETCFNLFDPIIK